MAACPVDGTPLAPTDPLLGTVLGERYRVLARIGAGGMGTVYRVEHVVLRKRMAAKVLRPELSGDQDLVRRFQQEAIAVSQIGQENIVDVTDFGRTPQGALYYVMEELEGASHAALVEAGPLPVDRAAGILAQICRALAAAHERGIVHRDLKPDNVMVVRRGDGSDFAKVLDFGIAKSAAAPETGRVTRAGMVIGTPEYMAPEQGAAARVDHRADVYAFGVLAYEMVTGRVPFSAATPVATMLEHQTRAVVPPRLLRPDLPPSLEALILHALEKRAEARPQSMREVAAALTAVLAERGLPPVYERTPTPPPAGSQAPTRELPAAAHATPVAAAGATGTGATGRRRTTGRGATLSMELPGRNHRLRLRNRRTALGAPRRGRIAVVAVLTAALVVAAIAASTWRSSGAPTPPPAHGTAPR